MTPPAGSAPTPRPAVCGAAASARNTSAADGSRGPGDGCGADRGLDGVRPGGRRPDGAADRGARHRRARPSSGAGGAARPAAESAAARRRDTGGTARRGGTWPASGRTHVPQDAREGLRARVGRALPGPVAAVVGVAEVPVAAAVTSMPVVDASLVNTARPHPAGDRDASRDVPRLPAGTRAWGRRMRLSTVILPVRRWHDGGREQWVRAERLGFHAVYTYDHLSWRSLRRSVTSASKGACCGWWTMNQSRQLRDEVCATSSHLVVRRRLLGRAEGPR